MEQIEIVQIGRALSAYAALSGSPLSPGFREKLAEVAGRADSGRLDPVAEQELTNSIAETMALLRPRTLHEIRGALRGASPRATAVADVVYGSVFVFAICLLLFLIIPLSVYYDQLKNCANSLQESAQKNVDEIAKDQEKFSQFAARVATDIGFANQQVRLVFDTPRGYVGWTVAWFMPADPRTISSEQTAGRSSNLDGAANSQTKHKSTSGRQTTGGQPADVAGAVVVVTAASDVPANGAASPGVENQTHSALPSSNAAVSTPSNGGGSQSDNLSQQKGSLIETIGLYSRIMAPLATLVGGSLLPLLFGFLGATVYLLRTGLDSVMGTNSPRNIALTAILRIGLGGVAGLGIGWFQTDATKFTTAPFALAFLAGFSIELLFSLLDRIIAAIGSSTPMKSSS